MDVLSGLWLSDERLTTHQEGFELSTRRQDSFLFKIMLPVVQFH